MMDAANIFETSVHFYQATWRNIQKVVICCFHIRRRENLKISQE
jgi:hypothetical protein